MMAEIKSEPDANRARVKMDALNWLAARFNRADFGGWPCGYPLRSSRRCPAPGRTCVSSPWGYDELDSLPYYAVNSNCPVRADGEPSPFASLLRFRLLIEGLLPW
jgi:hypothetical protein